MSIPSIPALRWVVAGATLIAWINDVELYSIGPAEIGDDVALYLSGPYRSELLGTFASVAEARRAARTHVGDDEPGVDLGGLVL